MTSNTHLTLLSVIRRGISLSLAAACLTLLASCDEEQSSFDSTYERDSAAHLQDNYNRNGNINDNSR
ncbi:MAG: hypothetical protein ACAI34_01335 [Verrucomicrobium sp.]|nr:hypothetical protein [Verrucomicrobium sp.]